MKQTIEVALEQLGVKEDKEPNSGIPSTRYCMGEKLPWCAAFILYCNKESTDTKITSNEAQRWTLREVAALEQHFRDKGWWLPPDSTPRRNDIIFFASRGGSDAGGGRHVGIVEDPNVSVFEPTLRSVEGNVGDRVQQVAHRLNDPATKARITGYGRLP